MRGCDVPSGEPDEVSRLESPGFLVACVIGFLVFGLRALEFFLRLVMNGMVLLREVFGGGVWTCSGASGCYSEGTAEM